MNNSFKISIAISVVFMLFAIMLFSLNRKAPCSAETNKRSDCSYKILVPNLVGQEYDKVKQEHNLINVSKEYNEEFKEGIIINQNPSSGSISKENETILVTTSKGSAFAELPFVIGKYLGEASICLSDCGFVPKAVLVPYQGEEGLVLNYRDISYEKGMKLEKGKEILLEVSS